MRLMKLRLDGYRRFNAQQSLRVEGKLVAIVGPNEAGKSSLLQAMTKVTSEEEFRADPGDRELSRGLELAKNHVVLEALFALDEHERQQLVEAFDVGNISTFWVAKKVSGATSIELDESTRPFTEAIGETGRLAALRVARAAGKSPPEGHGAVLRDIVALLERTGRVNLERVREQRTKLRQLSNRRAEPLWDELGEYLREVDDACTEVIEKEDRIASTLRAWLPAFRLFKVEDRELRSSYAITGRASQPQAKRRPAPDIDFPDANHALEHLLASTGMKREALPLAVRSGFPDEVSKWVDRANLALTSILREGWTQSDVQMKLYVDGRRLHIMVGSAEGYSPLEERSEGMRMFVALAAFITAQAPNSCDTILLIDEAEQHLHYDAQANLMEMLLQQTHARQVVYSTHSAGCLPEDLGTSVRAVRLTGDQTSEIINSIWHGGKSGFRPLYLALGASTLAFNSVRRAVFVEGVIDSALLPTLLREATGTDALGYQLVPGVAQADSRTYPAMIDEAKRVAFLLDGDAGGDVIASEMRRWKVQKKQIFRLPKGCVCEDLVDERVYLSAVNEVIAKKHPHMSLHLDDIRTPNRPKAVNLACAKLGIEPPDKTAVAGRLLEHAHGANHQTLLSSSRRRQVAGLHSRIYSYLDPVPSS